MTGIEAVRQLVRKLATLENFTGDAQGLFGNHYVTEQISLVDAIAAAAVSEAVNEITGFLFEVGKHHEVLETLWDSNRTDAGLKRVIAQGELGIDTPPVGESARKRGRKPKLAVVA